MRQNICIILNAKSRKDVDKELNETLNLYKENCNCNTEYELHLTKDMISQEYEDFKQKYRNLNPRIIECRLVKSGCKDVEEYIQYVLETIYGWSTLEDYAYDRYKVARFEGNKAIALYNPKGYIDYVEHIITCDKYRKFTSKKIKDFDIAEVILLDKTEIKWDDKISYKSNKLRIKQTINRYATKNTYIAIVRVHF